jgi:CheY-like chemotaxis protein
MATTPDAEAIVVAEDDPTTRELLPLVLGDAGYRVRAAARGEEALALARAARPPLILLSVRLPGLAGVAVCRRLQGDPRTRDIPVLFVTAAAGELPGDCRGAAVLPKPSHPDALLAAVRRHAAPAPPP